MQKMIQMFYPDVDHGTFQVESLNALPASCFFSCASTAVAAEATTTEAGNITSTKRTLATA